MWSELFNVGSSKMSHWYVAVSLSILSCQPIDTPKVCVQEFRSCQPGGPPNCDDADECVPAEAYGSGGEPAVTECDEGFCTWDCSNDEMCPAGWVCKPVRPTLVEALKGEC